MILLLRTRSHGDKVKDGLLYNNNNNNNMVLQIVSEPVYTCSWCCTLCIPLSRIIYFTSIHNYIYIESAVFYFTVFLVNGCGLL